MEALRAEIDEGAAGRRRGREGKMMVTRQAGKRPGRRAMTQVGDGQLGREAGREAGIINSVFKIFNKYIIMRQKTFISVDNIGGLPPIPHFVPFYVPFSR